LAALLVDWKEATKADLKVLLTDQKMAEMTDAQ
jgi:hypothetical protein